MPRTKSRTSSDIVDEMHDLREQYRALDEESNALKSKYAELGEELLAFFDADGSDMTRTDLATASKKEELVANIEDPKTFWKWVSRYKKWHLVQNRMSNPAYRQEMENRTKEIPGVKSYTKYSILLKTRS